MRNYGFDHIKKYDDGAYDHTQKFTKYSYSILRAYILTYVPKEYSDGLRTVACYPSQTCQGKLLKNQNHLDLLVLHLFV